MTASAWDKFLLLSWKNWIIQLRHPIQTIFEILVPVTVCALIVLVRGLVDVTEFDEDFKYNPISTAKFGNIRLYKGVNFKLAYSPKNPLLEKIVNNVAQELNFTMVNTSLNAIELEEWAVANKPFASIEFEDFLWNITELPDVITYALRFPSELRQNGSSLSGYYGNWATNYALSSKFTVGARYKDLDDGGTRPGYIPQGFIALQNSIERQIIYTAAPGLHPDDIPELLIQRFPYPAYVNDIIGFILEFAFPYLFLMAFVYNVINIIKYITIEKELQLKESMKIMGLPSYMHWIAWFTKCMIFQIVIISILTGLFKIHLAHGLAVFTNGNWMIIWLFFFVYVMAAVTYSLMFSAFFNKANIASIVGAITWFVLLLPFLLLSPNYNSLKLNIKLAASLFCNSGMGFGIKIMTQYESAGGGVQWSNLFTPVTPDDDLTLGAIMIMMLIASVLQILITLYVEKIKPGEFGVPEKFYFPFTFKFWFGRVKIKNNEDDLLYKNDTNFEAEPKWMKAGIQVRGLRKVYDKKVAVKNLNLNMYEDQITVLLGHNGAGKSTTMSMLTGLYQPTAGTAYINGKDIRTDLDSIRSSLGLCPQHNVLFNELTVKEHITFFSNLKGIKKQKDIDEEIRKYVNMLELTPKLNEQSKTLAGGMKRKLSIGIALCGNSKIVMCDEPTSGMDPAARRALWDLLIQEKKGRTILLTTHFMDEADVLGDRIAIMADGDLKTVGSSFFLKKKFGVGYRLVCVKAPGCNVDEVTNLLAKYIPEIEVETSIGSELTYVLKEDHVSKFKTIFADLETKSEELKISSFGVSLTTLEEVFLKVGSDTHALKTEDTQLDLFKLDSKIDIKNYDHEKGFSSTDVLTLDHSMFLTGPRLLWSQTKAMFLKKFLYSTRNYILVIVQFVIPALFVVLTMMIEDFDLSAKELPALPISFDKYLATVTTVEKGSYKNGSTIENVFKSYERIINGFPSGHTLKVTTRDFQDEILDRYRNSISEVNLNHMIGASFNASQIKVWFNNQGYHTAPLAINTINNAILKSFSTNSKKTINLINKPLPFSQSTKMSQLRENNNMIFNVAFNTGFAMAFVTGMFVMFYIKERVSRAKLLQFVSGVNKIIFWLTSFIIDYAIFIAISLVFFIVLAAYNKEGYSTVLDLSRNFLILLTFGFAVLPYTYVWSFLFQIPSIGLVRLSIGYVISGVFFYLAYFVLNHELLGLQYLAEPLGWFFLMFPHYSLARGMSKLNTKQAILGFCDIHCSNVPDCKPFGMQSICDNSSILCSEPALSKICELKNSCCDRNYYSLSDTGIGLNLIAFGLIGVVSFIVLLAIEYRWIQNLFYSSKNDERAINLPESQDSVIDSDVLAEKTRTRCTPLKVKNNLLVKDLTKFYGNMLAVNQLCVGVEKSECFGLLGVNGAGKTSTFKMLTGDETISSGEAWVDGLSVKTNMNQVHQRIGYCPQFDALLDDLTGRETLRIFALLKGIPRRDISIVIAQLAEEFAFTKHLDKRIKAYSGGNKRKLSTALSLIGNPSVIYLDEPTSGMDVGARRQLWNMVIKARNAGKSVVLTSHSMEECEVLCTRLAIMVNGEFKCLGSTQHLKNKFSKGFFLTIKIGSERNSYQQIVNVKNFVVSNFSGASLKEEYMDILTYHIPSVNLKWSHMFGRMEDAKEKLNISDYSLGQTSLEQVFLFFTKYQKAPVDLKLSEITKL